MMPYNWCPFMYKSPSGMNGYQQPDQMLPGQMMPGQMLPGQVMPGHMYPVYMPQFQQLQHPQGIHMLPGTGMMESFDIDNLPNVHMPLPELEDIQEEEELTMEGITTDPPPVLSNNPEVATIVLFKELTGYPNYGNPSGNADILYTGNRGVWTFSVPAILLLTGNLRAQLVIRAVLDDHSSVAVDRYSATISINGTTVHTGRLRLEHGRPAGGRFTNWSSLTFNVPNLRRNNRIVIVNTSNTGSNDWIGLDWMEMRISQAT